MIRNLLFVCVLCALFGRASAETEQQRRSYLQWMQKSLTQVPEWNAWQQATGELPPDFDLLPKSNLLPDPLRFFDGRPVGPAEWRERRAEILSLFEKYVTGTFPEKPTVSRVELLDRTQGEGYTLTNVRVWFGPQGKGSVRIRLVVPDAAPGVKMPVLIAPSLAGWGSALIRRGYISAGYAGNDFMDDAAPLAELYPDYDFATLPRRAWLAQVVVDYLSTVEQVDMERIAIFGYSRDGKMATMAAALDERIAAVVAGSTGVGGLVPWRYAGERGGGEGIESTTRMFPSWFVPRMRFFAGHEDRLPVDANLLISLVAPRAILMQWGFTDQVANGWAMEQAWQSANKVYERLGAEGKMDMLAIEGFHGANDQQACIDWLDWQFGRSDKPWQSRFVFPWNFDEWRSRSGETLEAPGVPVRAAAHKRTSVKAWEKEADALRGAVGWMLGDTPAVLAPVPGEGMGMMRRGGGRNAGPTEIAKGTVGNPAQLSPDVAAWVITNTSPEFGWRAPERNQVESRRIRFGEASGDLYYPAGTPEGAKLPTVVWLHGFHYPLGYMWVYRRDLHPILALVRAGYAVLAYDQSGFGTRWSEAEHFHERYPHWSRMGKMVEDLRLAVDALEKEDVVDGGNISLYGFSMGGTLGLYAAAFDPRIRSVVSVCGFTPMRTDTAERGMSGATRYSHLYGLIPRIGLYAGQEEKLPYDYQDVISLIAPRPVLVVQPTMDRDASPEEVAGAVAGAAEVYALYGRRDALGFQQPEDYGRLTDAIQDKAIEWLDSKVKTK